MNLRILYVSSIDISKANGPGVNEREFINCLVNVFKNNVYVISTCSKKNDFKYTPRIVAFIRPKSGIAGYFLTQARIFKAMRSALRVNKFDLIITRLDLLSLSVFFQVLVDKIPLMIKTFPDSTMTYLLRKKGLKGVIANLLYYPHKWILKYLAFKAKGIDCCTPQLRESAVKNLNIDAEKIIHIDNACNTRRFYPVPKHVAKGQTGLTGFKPIVGFVGGKPSERGGAQMIECIPFLKEVHQNIGCAIVGYDEKLKNLVSRASELGVLENCVFPGVVPYIDVPRWINSFDVCVALDSEQHMSCVGSSNQKIRQYVACGKPVIAMCGGNFFLEKENLGTLVGGQDIPGIVSALREWLAKSESDMKEHEIKAVSFAQKHLTVEKALSDRIGFWHQMLEKDRK